MLDFEQGFVPIQDANTDRTHFIITFPEWVQTERIGVNLVDLRRLLRIGGIRHLMVVGQTEGETTRFIPTIVGYDSQGNAYAGTKTEKVSIPEFTTRNGEDNPNLYDAKFSHPITWRNAVISININEMAERIRQENRWSRGVHSTEAWAHHLNGVLKKGVSDIGIRHLILGLNKGAWFLTASQYALTGVLVPFTRFPSVESVPLSILFSFGCLNLLHFILFKNKTDDGFRWSAFYGPQPDRALLLKILAGRGNLVRSFADIPT